MIQIDPRDGGDLGVGGGCRVVASAHSSFEDGEFDVCFGEGDEGDGGDLFEVGWDGFEVAL